MVQRKDHEIIDGFEKKHCYNCDLYKHLEEFTYCRTNWDKLAIRCKWCERTIKRDAQIKKRSLTIPETKVCEICKETKSSYWFDRS